jgi:hypothetical protein
MDVRGLASTNRQVVSNVYIKRFKKCQPIKLETTKETGFNGHPIYDSYSTLLGSRSEGTVVVWEIDAEGNEMYHGNWE